METLSASDRESHQSAAWRGFSLMNFNFSMVDLSSNPASHSINFSFSDCNFTVGDFTKFTIFRTTIHNPEELPPHAKGNKLAGRFRSFIALLWRVDSGLCFVIELSRLAHEVERLLPIQKSQESLRNSCDNGGFHRSSERQ